MSSVEPIELTDRADVKSAHLTMRYEGLQDSVAASKGMTAPLTALTLVLADSLTVIACAAVAILLRRDILPALSELNAFAPVRDYASLWPALVLLLLGRAAVGLYPGYGLHPAEELRRQTWVTVGLVLTVMAGGALFSFSTDYSRVVLVLTAVLLTVMLPVTRSGLKNLLVHWGRFGTPVWIIGASPRASELANLLSISPEFGLIPIGLGPDVPPRSVNCNRCLVVPDGLVDRPLASMLDDLTDRFQRVWLVPDLLDIASVWVSPRDIQGHLALELRNNLLESRNKVIKRLLDVLACIALVPLAVVLGGATALAIRLSAPGPVIIRQRRVGSAGREFTLLKFRTMHVDAEARLASLLESDPAAREEWRQSRKLTHDPRVTPLGRFLRKSSLDEVPQILNVLVGDMSLVGPRPVMPDEVAWYGASAGLLLRVKPGLTGLTQISGRSTLNYETRVRLDTYYVRNWSVWLDLVVLGRTLGSVLRSEGAF